MNVTPSRRILLIIASLAVIGASCSDSTATTTEPTLESESPTTTTTAASVETTTTTAAPAPVAAVDGTINVTLTNWKFSPTAYSVTSGEPVVVNLENLSTRSHNWALLTAGTHWTSSEDLDLDQILAATQGIPAETTDTLEFTAPEPGTYQVVCTIQGHIQQGMVAELIVTA